MIYTVTEVATGRVVGASVEDWHAALRDMFNSKNMTRIDVFAQFAYASKDFADGFTLHGYKLGIKKE
jgi:hypothetical protein